MRPFLIRRRRESDFFNNSHYAANTVFRLFCTTNFHESVYLAINFEYLSLFALMQKVTKKIKAVLKSYDFAKAPAARKKLVPPASGLKQFFA
jgi:hypothetical protein